MNVLIRWSQLKGLTSVCVFIWILKLDACVICIQVKEWLLERSEKKIKIVNSNFHNQITDHVTVLISEQVVFVSGTSSAFSEVRKSSESGFFSFYVPHVFPILQEENGPIMIPRTVLKLKLWRGQ